MRQRGGEGEGSGPNIRGRLIISKSHSAAHGMHAYTARELRAKMHAVTPALQLFTLHFLSWWSSQSNPNKLK